MVPETLACQSRIAASTKAGAAINKTEEADAAFEWGRAADVFCGAQVWVRG